MRGVLLFVILAVAQSSAFVARSPSEHVAKQLRSCSSDVKLMHVPLEAHSRGQRLCKSSNQAFDLPACPISTHCEHLVFNISATPELAVLLNSYFFL
jgi:hypothetical protein